MYKLNNTLDYINILEDVICVYRDWISHETTEYILQWIIYIPKGFDNDVEKWKNYFINSFPKNNYRYGLHNSFAGIIAEVLTEVALVKYDIPILQKFEDKISQVDDEVDSIVGAGITCQTKSVTEINNFLTVYESHLSKATLTTFVDIEKRIVYFILTKKLLKEFYKQYDGDKSLISTKCFEHIPL